MRRYRCSSAPGKRSEWTRGPTPTSAARLAEWSCVCPRTHSKTCVGLVYALFSANGRACNELRDMQKHSRCTNAPSQTLPLPHCQAPAQLADLASSEQLTLKPRGDRQHARMQQTRCVQLYILAVQVVADSGSPAALNHIAVPTGREQSRKPLQKRRAHGSKVGHWPTWNVSPPADPRL